MTFKTTACITIHCDECGVVLDYDDHIPHFETEAKALEAAETYDWFVKGGKHLCDDHSPVCSCDDCDHTPPCGYEVCSSCERHKANAPTPAELERWGKIAPLPPFDPTEVRAHPGTGQPMTAIELPADGVMRDVDPDRAPRRRHAVAQAEPGGVPRHQARGSGQRDHRTPRRRQDVLTIGEQLRAARVMRRFTQGQLAEQVGTVQSAVSEWENGTTQPGLPLIERIAKVLGFDVIAVLVPWEVTGGTDLPRLARPRPALTDRPADTTPAPTA